MSDEFLQIFLVWILPPFIGAVIGYVTNALAIKMLFRPLREVRVFGIRLPLTPGIIPRQRHALAESIGNMVAKNLITPDAIRAHLANPGFREALAREISLFTSRISETELSFLSRERLEAFFGLIEGFFAKSLERLFQSERFLDTARGLISELLASLAEKDVDRVLDPEFLKNVVCTTALPFLTGERTQAWISSELDRWIDERLRENRPIADIIPGSVVDDVFSSFTRFVPELVKLLFDWLSSPDVRLEIETQGRILVKNITGKLNSVQQLVVSIAQYDKTLHEKMPEIVSDTLDSLREAASSAKNQAHFIEQAKRGITGWIAHGVGDIITNKDGGMRDTAKALIARLFSLLASPATGEFVKKNIDGLYLGGRTETLGEFLERQFGFKLVSFADTIVPQIESMIRSPGVAEKTATSITSVLVSVLSSMREMRISQIIPAHGDAKIAIDAFVTEKALTLFGDNLPSIVEGLQIKKLVVDKVNSLDVADVEKLLLMVIAKHLKWINIIGAVLGAAIGFSQVLLDIFF